MAHNVNQAPLSRLITKLKISFLLAILGLWGLLIPRLSLYGFDHELFNGPKAFFYLDVASLAVFFFGLLLAIYYSIRLKPRLRRIDELGEGQW